MPVKRRLYRPLLALTLGLFGMLYTLLYVADRDQLAEEARV